MAGLSINGLRWSVGLIISGFFLGVIWSSYDLIDTSYLGLVLLIGFGLMGVSYFQTNFKVAFLGLLLLGFCVGGLRFNQTQIQPVASLEAKLGQNISVTGQIVDEPDERETGLRLLVKPNNLDQSVLVVVPLGSEVEYGDEVEVVGQISKPKNFLTDTGREFDYVNYLKVQRVQYLISRGEVKKIKAGQWWSPVRILFTIKQSFISNLERDIPEPAVSLASGLVVGAKQGLGKDWQEDFRRVGLVHIVVLSGYNITIVAENILKLAGLFLPRLVALSVGGFSIILFAVMVGGGSTVIRSSVMALLVLVARATGRNYDIAVALILAAFGMIFYNPLVLVFDVGFQLSFLSTIGLIYGTTILESYLTRVPERFGLRDIVGSTLATQLFVLPWLLYKVGQLSVVALPVNLLVLPMVPLTMLVVFLTGLIGFVGHWFSFIFAGFSLVTLSYILMIVKWWSFLPFAAFLVPTLPLVVVVVWYGIYFWFGFKRLHPLGKKL